MYLAGSFSETGTIRGWDTVASAPVIIAWGKTCPGLVDEDEDEEGTPVIGRFELE